MKVATAQLLENWTMQLERGEAKLTQFQTSKLLAYAGDDIAAAEGRHGGVSTMFCSEPNLRQNKGDKGGEAADRHLTFWGRGHGREVTSRNMARPEKYIGHTQTCESWTEP